MKTTANPPASRLTIGLNKTKTFFSKPYNVILLLMGIVVTITTIAPIVAIVEDTFKIHPGTIDAHLTGQTAGYTLVNYIDLFTSTLAKTNLWTPLLNTIYLAVGTCLVSILFGGLFAVNQNLLRQPIILCVQRLNRFFRRVEQNGVIFGNFVHNTCPP